VSWRAIRFCARVGEARKTPVPRPAHLRRPTRRLEPATQVRDRAAQRDLRSGLAVLPTFTRRRADPDWNSYVGGTQMAGHGSRTSMTAPARSARCRQSRQVEPFRAADACPSTTAPVVEGIESENCAAVVYRAIDHRCNAVLVRATAAGWHRPPRSEGRRRDAGRTNAGANLLDFGRVKSDASPAPRRARGWSRRPALPLTVLGTISRSFSTWLRDSSKTRMAIRGPASSRSTPCFTRCSLVSEVLGGKTHAT